MIEIRARDESLAALRGKEVASTVVPGVTYWLGEPIGEGGMCVAFLALRIAPEGRSPVVIKIVRPSFVRQSPDAGLVIQKEAVALGRLNERIPPTPFVVTLIDTGALPVSLEGTPLDLPWVGVEYVHGGAEGTTLHERVRNSLRTTGSAFDPARAAHAIMCLSRGLAAVHDVGVIHRDITPNNVLCCNFGEDEIFKIADFGVARPIGATATFQGELCGTPGYAAPELQQRDPTALGAWTDVFGLAAVIFQLLSGEEYFPARNAWEHVVAVGSPRRRSLLDVATISPELRARPDIARSLDQELARATAVDGAKRHSSADSLGAALLRWLPHESRRALSAVRRIEHPAPRAEPHETGSPWKWTVRHLPGSAFRIRRAAWDGDGRCLALADQGLVFWNGTAWRALPPGDGTPPASLRFVHRAGPGRFIVGGDAATFASYTAEGVETVNRGEDPSMRYEHFSGDVNDLGVLVGRRDADVHLHALVGGWWLKPLSLPEAAEITSLARFDRTRWLVAGELKTGGGFAALYAPLEWEAKAVVQSPLESFAAVACHSDRQSGFAVTRDGTVVWCHGTDVYLEQVGVRGTITSAAMDAMGRAWIGGAGELWTREPVEGQTSWTRVPVEATGFDSVATLFADDGLVLVVTEDGGVFDGRLRPSGTGAAAAGTD